MIQMQQGERKQRPRAAFAAPQDGVTVVMIEGIAHQQAAQRVCNEIARRLDDAFKRGMSHVLIAIPPPAQLTLARGREIEMKATVDGRVMMQLKGTPSGGAILLPGVDW